jgi:hypothetical protein
VSGVYNEGEELMLAQPTDLQPGEAVCDRWGCDQMAATLVPGAALCHDCAAEFGVDGGGIYRIPPSELVGDERWREARTAHYLELVRLYPIERNPERDRRLERIAARHIDDLLGGAE